MGAPVLTKLQEALTGVSALGFDTSPFIYFIEKHPVHAQVLREVFRRLNAGKIEGFSSVVTLTEVLTKPKQVGAPQIEREYRDLLLQSRHFTLLPIDAALAERAADLRARHQLRTPDALQIAAALNAGCEGFLTNDRRLRHDLGLRMLLLDELEL